LRSDRRILFCASLWGDLDFGHFGESESSMIGPLMVAFCWGALAGVCAYGFVDWLAARKKIRAENARERLEAV
jgi:hypothetical protein